MDVLKRRYNIEDFLGEGWYPIEADSVVKWAWSKKESLLRFPADHSGFFLKFSACPIESIDLTVCHQDRQLYTDKFKDPNFTINIPPNITSCKISLEETWNPREVLGGLDDRQLGICLIEVSPLLSEICEHPPYTLELGLTSICNINPPCVMCPAQNLKQSKAQAHLSDVILDKIKPYFNSAKIVSLHGGEGEPLLSPRLFEFLSSIDTSNVYTLFATNGLLLTKGLSSKLISAGLREIQFSIDGATPLTYRKIRNNDGFFTLINNHCCPN